MQEIQFFYEKDSGKEYIISSEEIQVEMRAPEGTQKIYYQLGGQAYACLNGENVSVTVPIGFQGKIGAYFIDRTGTQSNVFFSKEIICENQSPNVVMTLPQGFEVWYHHAITTEIEIEEQGACSGIKSIRCLVNGVEMQKKIYGEREKMKEHLSVPIDKTSVTVVKVEDWAGNCDTIERNVLFDAQSPQVKFEGMENHMITNETKEICCMVSDEQELPVLKGNITWVNPDGIAVSKVIEHWEKEGAWYVAREKIEEEGT